LLSPLEGNTTGRLLQVSTIRSYPRRLWKLGLGDMIEDDICIAGSEMSTLVSTDAW